MILRSFLFLVLGIFGAEASFKDDTSAIFLPKSMAELAQTAQEFPYFWKGLYLVDAQNESQAIAHAENFCQLMKSEALIADYFCTQSDFKQNDQVLRDWVRDTSLREKIPSQAEFVVRAQKQLSLASMPAVPRSFLTSLRVDPLGSSQEFWSLKEASFSFPAKLGGYFSNQEKNLLIIPFSFLSAPQDIESNQSFLEKAKDLCNENCPKVALVGPHAAVWVNQTQVLDDLTLVSVLGAALFILTILLMGWSRGVALLSLFIPLVIALAVAVAVTLWVFGSIHGLTLAFGPSLVGLVLDYGIHTKIHQGSKAAWSSNLFGFLTTISGFVALVFSEIPLVRQIMVFSVVGLVCSFVLYYFFSQSKSRLWTGTEFKVFSFQMDPRKWQGPFALALMVSAFALAPFMKLDLNLKNFEFRQKHQNELEKKLWSSGAPEILFSRNKVSELDRVEEQAAFAQAHQVKKQSWSTYVRPESFQKENLATWTHKNWQSLSLKDANAQKFFAPFYDLDLYRNEVATPARAPSYATDFLNRDKSELLTVWFPQSNLQKEEIIQSYPQVTSLRSLFDSFPKLLLNEIILMFPIGLLVCFFLIYYHVRRISHSLLALVPMFCSMGLVFLASLIFDKALSFVSCMALLMIFGSSIDYGIFKVDSLREAPTPEAEAKIFSSLFMNALLTFVGYLPLVFARHPVLNDLGWVLTLGTVGAFLGGVWGVSYLSSFSLSKFKSAARKI